MSAEEPRLPGRRGASLRPAVTAAATSDDPEVIAEWARWRREEAEKGEEV